MRWTSQAQGSRCAVDLGNPTAWWPPPTASATAIEDLQELLGQGPCVDEVRSGRPVLVPDLDLYRVDVGPLSRKAIAT